MALLQGYYFLHGVDVPSEHHFIGDLLVICVVQRLETYGILSDHILTVIGKNSSSMDFK